ncbi:PREDICTED: palladin-like, partial [Cariama cristata]|uniref:palladin-like n=1 Tax=Cariama cristata TaxID=54380 RepID=UPI000520C8B2
MDRIDLENGPVRLDLKYEQSGLHTSFLKEICTLVIAETFPEDSGLFTCTATNEYGSVTSSAQLTVCSANSESSSHEPLTRESNSDDFQHFPPLPPVEISSLELPPKKHTEHHQANNTELRSGVTAVELQLNSSEEKTNGTHPIHGVNGMINSKPNGDKPIPPPAALLSPTKEPPPVLAKPKLGHRCIQRCERDTITRILSVADVQIDNLGIPSAIALESYILPSTTLGAQEADLGCSQDKCFAWPKLV